MKRLESTDERIAREEDKLRKMYNPAFSPVNRSRADEKMEEREKRRKQQTNEKTEERNKRRKQPRAGEFKPPPLWLRHKLNYKPPAAVHFEVGQKKTFEQFYEERFNAMLREKLEREAKYPEP